MPNNQSLLGRFLCWLELHRAPWRPSDFANEFDDGSKVFILRYRRCNGCGSLREVQYRGEGGCW